MRAFKILLMSLIFFIGGWFNVLLPQSSEQGENVSSCISCHLEMGDELAAPVHEMEQDVHHQQGLSCVDCHGGDATADPEDMEAAMDPAKGYIGIPKRTEIPQFCARCHSDPNYMRQYNPRVSTDQLDRYKTSVHGKRLLQQGDTTVATCIDCHGVHGILNAKDSRSSVHPLSITETCGNCHADSEYMEDYSIPTDQISQYTQSVHGKALLEKGDLAAPACNDCHGNHGASPPGAPSVAFICGQCHLNNSELFMKSPHKSAFEEMGLPECEACHGNHAIQHPTDNMLGAGEQSLCIDCHEEGSKGLNTAVAMYEQIDTLKEKINHADSLITKAERAGMQVSEAQFNLNDADDALIKSRTIVHSLSVNQIKETTGKGIKLANDAIEAGKQAMSELQFRRKGLAISIIFISFLAIGLYFKIKEIDKKHPIRSHSE